jgi:hypothetical protein
MSDRSLAISPLSQTEFTAQPSPPIIPTSSPAVTGIRTICATFRESLAAHRRYEHLTSRGMPHDAALREALGIGLGAAPQKGP